MDRSRTKGERRRQEALSAARRHLIESGLERLTLRSLADELGMTLGNLQYYFPSRDDLLEAVLRAEAARDLAAFESAVAGAEPRAAATTTDDPGERLRDAVSALADRWYALNGSVYLPFAVRAVHDDRFGTVVREIWETFYGALAPVVREIDPSISPTEARRRAMLIVMLLDGSSIQPYAPTGQLSRGSMTTALAATAVRIARGD